MKSQLEDDEESAAFQEALDEEDFGKQELLLAATTSEGAFRVDLLDSLVSV